MADARTELPFPSDWPTFTAVGSIARLGADTADADDNPNAFVAVGSVRIAPRRDTVLYKGAAGSRMYILESVTAVLGADGTMRRLYDDSTVGPAGVTLPASDTDVLREQGWTYDVALTVTGLAKDMRWSIPAHSGSTVDIFEEMPSTASSGTSRLELTTEVRAAIQKIATDAASGVQVDTSGLATTDALQEVQAALGTKVNSATYAAEIAKRPTVPEVEQIALENALLNEDEPVTRVGIVDGGLVLTRRDGVEITAEGSIATGAVVRTLAWDDLQRDPMWFEQQGGWISKNGQLVTLCVRNAKLVAGARLTPAAMPGGAVAGAPGGGGLVLDVLMVDASGVAKRASGDLSEWVYDAAIFVPGTHSGTAEAPEVVPELRITWATADPAPLEIGTALSDA